MQPAPLPISADLVDRLERAALRHGRDALLRAAALPGNPYNVSVDERDVLTSYRVGSVRELPWYNNILCHGDVETVEMEEVLASYFTRHMAPQVTTSAARRSPMLEKILSRHGFEPSHKGATLFAELHHLTSVSTPGVQVRALSLDEDIDGYNSLLIDGYGFAHPVQRALAVLEHTGADVRRYMAFIDGVPAAVGALTRHDDIAYLAGACTLAAFRGRGAQTALIQRRLADASHTSELAVVTTAFASPSQHHLERCGFRTSQIKTLWRQRQ